MAEKILIMGESGTGKTASLRNFSPDEIAIVNPVGKPLPFRGVYDKLDGVTDASVIVKYMKNSVAAGKKVIAVDDFQYILSIPYMNRIKEAGWDKWNDFGSNYFEIIDYCAVLPSDVTVYFLTHTETLENGITTIKLIGKLLREKITIEGLFTTVLRTQVIDGKYYFLTQNSGKDTVKSPIGMFGTYAIDNDLKYVDEKIRNYYQMDGCKTDAEMQEADKSAEAGEIEKAGNGRTRRSKRENQAKEEKPGFNADLSDMKPEDFPFEVTEEDLKAAAKAEQPKRTRRTRKER